MKADLLSYLNGGRDALLWKLDGLSEYDIRRPLTPTATNLLGLVKHSAAMETPYFGVVFGRPFPQEATRPSLIAETQRHAGHADIVRELIDGTAGLLPGNDNLPAGDPTWWQGYRRQVEQAALDAGERAG